MVRFQLSSMLASASGRRDRGSTEIVHDKEAADQNGNEKYDTEPRGS